MRSTSRPQRQLGSSMIGVPPLSPWNPLQELPNSPFSSLWPILHFTFFSHAKWNNFVPNLYEPPKYLLFSPMKVKIIKFIQCGPYSINGPKFSKKWFFQTFYIALRHLVFVIFIHAYTLANEVFVVKILGQKKLFRHYLWILELFFSHKSKSWIFFKDLVGILKLIEIWHFTHRIIFL